MRTELRGKYAIVGIGEPAAINRVPDKTEMAMGAEALLNAVHDAGISIKDIDGWFVPGDPSPNQAGEYMGIYPTYADGGHVGAVSPIALVGHAVAALSAGACTVAAVFHTSSIRSQVGTGREGPGDQSATIGGQFLTPYGVMGEYSRHAMVATRYMQLYGKTIEGFAELAVSTRQWAQLTTRAGFREPMTVEDVLKSRVVAWPLTIPMICPRTDNAAAIIITTAERARDLKQRPVYILGAAQAFENTIDFKEDLLDWEMVRKSGKAVFSMAGVRLGDINICQTHDCFIPVPVLELEGLGFCQKGEGLDFVGKGRTAPGGAFPMNTYGGGLSYTHGGNFGLAGICETVTQLRGDAGPRQVPSARVGLITGSGGGFSTNTSVIVTNQRP